MLDDDKFISENKVTVSAFTRNRKLPFKTVVAIILQNGLKSLQNKLNEFFDKLSDNIPAATASAFSQQRSKLKHTTFIDLNKQGIVDNFYSDGCYKKWHNFRLLAVDGSKIVVPSSTEIKDEFGAVNTTDNKGVARGEYNAALASVLYDVLNKVAIDSTLSSWHSSEIALAIGHLDQVGVGDVVLTDRNYPSYEFLASVVQASADFVGRCSRSSFKQARAMFDNPDVSSLVTTIKPHHPKKIRELGLPEELTVRFVRVVLSTGEPEVLVTSLLDESLTPEKFKEVYHLRWGVETFYHTLKSHLSLENFSGESVESVKQDFYASVFLASLESVVVDDAQASLDCRTSLYKQTVNHAVAFNTLRNNVMKLLHSEEDLESVLAKMSVLFLKTPVIKRSERRVERRTASPNRIANYLRRERKIVY